MAEAFGLAAGVLQVAGFGAEVGGALFKCAKKLHNASKELEAIAGQVEITSLSLRRVDELLRDPATEALHTPKLYEDTNTVSDGCHEVFRELDKCVKAYEAKSNGGKMKILTRTRWLFDSGRLMELGKVLRHYNDVLHLMVSVMTIVEGRRAATKDELQALEADLQLLAISNRDLSHSNKTLTETIAAISRAPKSPTPVKARELTPPAPPSTTNVAAITANGVQEGSPFIGFTALPPADTLQPVPQDPAASDPMTDHLRRCMDSVQELAKTIAGAMDAWHGKTEDSSDIHGSFSKLATHVSMLPKELQCVHCSRVVAWSGFKRPKLEPGAAGTCVCTKESSPKHWGPLGDVLQASDDLDLDMGFAIGIPPPAVGGAVDPSLFKPFKPTSAFGAQYPDISAISSPQKMAYPLMPSPSPSKNALRSPRSSNGLLQNSPRRHAKTFHSYSTSTGESELSQELDDEREKGLCPFPTYNRHFKDLKQHMLIHQNERPEKCHIPTCEYSTTGFARKYDKNRHVLAHYKGILVCGFCAGTTKEFTRADVFKRHLTSVHGVEQTSPNARRKTSHATKPSSSNVRGASGTCNICELVFADAQEFYEHLDDCVLLEITSSLSHDHESRPTGSPDSTAVTTRHKFELSDSSGHESEEAPEIAASETPNLEVQCPVTDAFDSVDFGASGTTSMDFAVGSGDALENFDFDKLLEDYEETSNMTLGGRVVALDYTDTRSDDDQVPLGGELPREGGRKRNSRLSSEARARSSKLRTMKDLDRSPSSGPTRTTFDKASSGQQPLSHSGLPADDEWSQERVQAWLAKHAFSAEWQAAFSHLEIYGMRFLELGVAGAQPNRSFIHRKLLPQVSREYEKAGLTTDTAREREAGRTLRRLVKTIVAEALPHSMNDESDTVPLKRARNTAAARQSRARKGERWYEEAQTHEPSWSPPAALVSSSKTQSESVSDSDSDDGLFAVPIGSGRTSSYPMSKRPTLGSSPYPWNEATNTSSKQPAQSTEDKTSQAYLPPPPPPGRMDLPSPPPILRPPVPGSNRKQTGGRLPRLGLSIPSSPYDRPVNHDNPLPKELNKSGLPPLSIPARTQPPKLSLATPMGIQKIPQGSSSKAKRKLTLQIPDSGDVIAHSRSNSFGHRREYNDTAGSTPSYSAIDFADMRQRPGMSGSAAGLLYSSGSVHSGGTGKDRMEDLPRPHHPVMSYRDHNMHLPPPANEQPMTSATYIPTTNSFGPDVGIPPLVPNAEAQDYERNRTDPGDTGGCKQRTPKKKVEKMALGDFLADQSLGSWADEMEDLPPHPAASNASSHHGKVNETVVFPNPDISATDSEDVSSVGSKKRKQNNSEYGARKRPHSETPASLAFVMSLRKGAGDNPSVEDEAAGGIEEEIDDAVHDATDNATDDAASCPVSHSEKNLSSPSPGKSLEEMSSLQALLGRWFNSGATATLLKTEI